MVYIRDRRVSLRDMPFNLQLFCLQFILFILLFFWTIRQLNMQSILQYRRLRSCIEQQIRIEPAAQVSYSEAISDAQAPSSTVSSDLAAAGPELLRAHPMLTLRDGRKLHVPGVQVRDVKPPEGGHGARAGTFFVVKFSGVDDKLDPKNWPQSLQWTTLGIVGTTGLLVGWASAIDTGVAKQAKEDFGVSEIVETLATSTYLIAFGFGSLIAAPFSETVGRNPVYIFTLCIFMLFIMASGLAPGIGAQLAFRFIAGLFGCTPLTTFGGSMADLFDPLGRTIAFSVCCCLSFLGPFLAPMVGAFIGQSSAISWRWAEWTSLIMAGVIAAAIFLFVPETYGPILLKWKAAHLRSITGDDRFIADVELRQASLPTRLGYSCLRPFKLFFGELVVALFTFYLAIVYAVLFGFLTGYNFIYGDTYGFSQELVGLAFIGMNVGFLIALAIIPHIYLKFKRDLDLAKAEGKTGLPPEERLWYAMYGAPWLPISLFWMGWTSLPSISPWSSLVASVAFGFSVQGIFISTYQYLIDTYEVYAASALVSATFVRYLVAGVMVVVSIPMYENLGVHWSLTLLGCLSLLMTPVPYIFYRYGERFRKGSRMARNPY